MSKIYTFIGAFLILMGLSTESSVIASAPAGEPAPAAQPSMCPKLTVSNIGVIIGGAYENPEGDPNTGVAGANWEISGAGQASISAWMQGNMSGELGAVLASKAKTGQYNLNAMQYLKNTHQPLLQITPNFVTLTVANTAAGQLFYRGTPGRVACAYKFYPTKIGRPGPIAGFEFYIERPAIAGEVGAENPPTAEQQAAAKAQYEGEIEYPLKLSLKDEANYMTTDRAVLKQNWPGFPESLRYLPPMIEGKLDWSHEDLSIADIISLAPFIKRFPGLTSLDISYNTLNNDTIRELANNFPQRLTTLLIHGDNPELTNAGLGYLRDKGFVKDGDGKWIRPIPAALLPLPPLLNYELLVIENRNLNVADINILAQNWPAGMTKLTLNNNNLGDAGMIALTQHLPASLEHIDITNNNIGDAGIIELTQHLPPNLRSIGASGNNFGDAGRQALINAHFVAEHSFPVVWSRALAAAPALAPAAAAPLLPLPPLEAGGLIIMNRNLSIADIAVLSQNWPAGITWLDLRNNNLGDAGVEALAPLLPAGLDIIIFKENHIGDAGVIALMQHLSPNLTHISLGENEFGEAGRQALINAGFVDSVENPGSWSRQVAAAPAPAAAPGDG